MSYKFHFIEESSLREAVSILTGNYSQHDYISKTTESVLTGNYNQELNISRTFAVICRKALDIAPDYKYQEGTKGQENGIFTIETEKSLEETIQTLEGFLYKNLRWQFLNYGAAHPVATEDWRLKFEGTEIIGDKPFHRMAVEFSNYTPIPW